MTNKPTILNEIAFQFWHYCWLGLFLFFLVRIAASYSSLTSTADVHVMRTLFVLCVLGLLLFLPGIIYYWARKRHPKKTPMGRLGILTFFILEILAMGVLFFVVSVLIMGDPAR
jgi:hypothetical protein